MNLLFIGCVTKNACLCARYNLKRCKSDFTEKGVYFVNPNLVGTKLDVTEQHLGNLFAPNFPCDSCQLGGCASNQLDNGPWNVLYPASLGPPPPHLKSSATVI